MSNDAPIDHQPSRILPEGIDPDEEHTVTTREVGAAIGLIDALIHELDGDLGDDGILDSLRSRVAHWMQMQADGAFQLPEVGPVDDIEGLRLFLHRLRDRLSRTGTLASELSPLLEDPPTAATTQIGAVSARHPSRSSALSGEELADWFVWWDDISDKDVTAYEHALGVAAGERDMQRYIARHPILLAQHLGGGHGRWVIPQKRLGAEYVTDFMIAERDSGGFSWQFVELQDPHANLFVPSSGRTSAQLDEGIRQIQEWRRWLEHNLDYARRARHENGLGLTNVHSRDRGIVIIGREHELSADDKIRRKQTGLDLGIDIHTYDWLIRAAKQRVTALAQYRESPPAE